MELENLITELRNLIGDTDLEEPTISDSELTTILKIAASGYSRLKNIIKRENIPYEYGEDIYDSPIDCYKVKEVKLLEHDKKLNFIDNLNQFILEELPDVEMGTLRITYNQHFQPEDIEEKELDIYLLYAEALCFKHMASKTAEYIKFSTGEKMVDESGVSEKYLKLYKEAEKNFKRKVVKAFGRRANNANINLDYPLPYPGLGEEP